MHLNIVSMIPPILDLNKANLSKFDLKPHSMLPHVASEGRVGLGLVIYARALVCVLRCSSHSAHNLSHDLTHALHESLTLLFY
jgi:hypothetical protein